MYSLPQRLGVQTEPIEGALWQWACMLRSSIPGIVQSFNPDTQLCVVQPAIMENVLRPPAPTVKVPNPGWTQNVPTREAIDPIQDVPIIMMRVPGWSITLPITAGTECLLIFADTCIDGWWDTGNVSAIYDRRRHDLSDAIALFGPWSNPKKLSNCSIDSLQIRSDDGTVIIDLSPGQINLIAPLVSTSGNLDVGSGASGTFTDQSGQIITVTNGIVTNIE